MRAFNTDHFELPLPEGHRFPMVKYRRLRERVIAEDSGISLEPPPSATDEQILRVHTRDYVDRVIKGNLDPVEIRRIGFPWSPAMVERSRRSTGATIAALSTALGDGIAANLAGGTHHAGPDRGQGYCVFNDAAVAICDLLAAGRIETAAVIDTDVHQGNGTAEVFARDDRVVTLSIHGEKNFPARKHPSDIDVSLPTGTSDAAYLDALDDALCTLFDRRRPDAVVFTTGADPFVDDTLGALALSKNGLKQRDRAVLDACLTRRIPTAVTMAGGYAECIDDVVDIHLETMRSAKRFHQNWHADNSSANTPD